jgi:hypothetical protein
MDQKAPFPILPMHFRGLLLLAGMYTIAWSAFFKWYGPTVVKWLSMNPDGFEVVSASYYGTFGIVVGLVIFVSAFYPVSWIYMIAAGIIGKVILALWFSFGFLPAIGWNKRSGFHLLFNELLWLIPLALILLRAHKVKDFLLKNEIQS